MSAGDAYARVKLQRFLAAFTQSLQTGRAVSKVLMSVIELQKWRTGGRVVGWWWRDRQTDTETEMRQKDRHRETEADRKTETERETERDRQTRVGVLHKKDMQQFVQALCSHRLLAVHCSPHRCA